MTFEQWTIPPEAHEAWKRYEKGTWTWWHIKMRLIGFCVGVPILFFMFNAG